MFEIILIPLDGSNLSEMALPYGEELAGRLGSELILLHVHGPEHQEYERMHRLYLDLMAENVRRNIAKKRPEGPEVQVITKVETGEPRENICNLVEKNDIGLIIMTTAGSSSTGTAKTLGSVPDQVCRTVPIPVMLIRNDNTEKFKGEKRIFSRILLPLDGSELSKKALPVGKELADKLMIPITLFQMVSVFLPYGGEAAPFVDYDKFTRDEEKRVSTEILALEKEITEKNLVVTHSITSGVDAAQEIIELGKKIGADLVVMSTHGRSGLGRFVLGSVAEKVLRYGETPLLLVNARA
jgi:nucleotide-binding universal stress UspA family protein